MNLFTKILQRMGAMLKHDGKNDFLLKSFSEEILIINCWIKTIQLQKYEDWFYFTSSTKL